MTAIDSSHSLPLVVCSCVCAAGARSFDPRGDGGGGHAGRGCGQAGRELQQLPRGAESNAMYPCYC